MEAQPNETQYFLSDINVRLKDLEEKNKILKEKTLLVGQNLLSLKEGAGLEMSELKKSISELKKEIEKMKSTMQNVIQEIGKFARKDEMLLIERMLKDFQPVEFARVEDIKEIIKNSKEMPESQQNKKQKNIKTQENIE